MAGYKVFRYEDIPEYYELRRDFLNEDEESAVASSPRILPKQYPLYSRLAQPKAKAVG